MKYVPFIVSHTVAIAVAALLAILTFQHFHDPIVQAERGRLQGALNEKTNALVLAHGETLSAREQFDSALAALPPVLIRWHTRPDTVRIPADATPHDSIVAVSQALTETKTSGDSVVRACTEVANSCAAFRAKATAEISAWQSRYAALDSLNRTPKPPKRLNVSLAIGYGYATPLNAIAPARQIFVGVSIGRSILSW